MNKYFRRLYSGIGIFWVGVIIVLLTVLPYMIMGEQSYIAIHDFLDQNLPLIKNLKENDLLTKSEGTIPNMDGLDRSLFPVYTPLNLRYILFQIFSPYWAVVGLIILCKEVGYIGMFLLLKNYILSDRYLWLILFLSVSFSLIPFAVDYSLSSPGIPILSYALINLYLHRSLLWSYILVALYSLNSFFELSGIFVIIVTFILYVSEYIYSRKLSKNLLFGLLMMTVIYIVTNVGIIYSFFGSASFTSHREEWHSMISLKGIIRMFLTILFQSQYHAGRILGGPVLLLFIFYWIKYRKSYRLLRQVGFITVIIVGCIFIGSLLKIFDYGMFKSFQFDRFYFLYPSLIFILGATIIKICLNNRRIVISSLITVYLLVAALFYNYELKNNIFLMMGRQISEPTFSQLYDVDLFSDIHKALGTSPDYKTKVASLGLFPAVAEYNGFYTIDGYRVLYPLDYKHKFREIIKDELKKDKAIEQYFDDWGSRCYLFSSELGTNYLNSKQDKKEILSLAYNIPSLKKMGCEYVFSAVNIKEVPEGLQFVDSFTRPSSYYRIYVYRVT